MLCCRRVPFGSLLVNAVCCGGVETKGFCIGPALGQRKTASSLEAGRRSSVADYKERNVTEQQVPEPGPQRVLRWARQGASSS
jgi:hypothetical protein